MPKRTVILIIILTILTGVLVFLALRNERQSDTAVPDPDPVTSETGLQIEQTATVTFEPETLESPPSTLSANTVDIVLDSKGYAIDSVQLELQYNPDILSNVTISASDQNFFGEEGAFIEPINIVDSERGRVTYAIAISPESAAAFEGIGPIATLSYSVNPQSTESATEIQVLERSMANEVTSHESVLAPADPLNIIITR